MTLVKVCGLRTINEAHAAADAGADLIGFIFWQPGRRYIAPEVAAQIIAVLRDTREKPPATVGVFVDPTLDEVTHAAALCGLDYVQLSGNESADLVRAMPRPALKAIHVRAGQEQSAAEDVANDAFGAQHYLLDTHADGLPGGTGVAFDWNALQMIGRRCFVAGGLRPPNVSTALKTLMPLGVDVSSGVENPAGGKDPTLIRAFLEAVRTYDHHQL